MTRSLREKLLIALISAGIPIIVSFVIIRTGVINDLRINKADKAYVDSENEKQDVACEKENEKLEKKINQTKTDIDEDIQEIKSSQIRTEEKLDKILFKVTKIEQ